MASACAAMSASGRSARRPMLSPPRTDEQDGNGNAKEHRALKRPPLGVQCRQRRPGDDPMALAALSVERRRAGPARPAGPMAADGGSTAAERSTAVGRGVRAGLRSEHRAVGRDDGERRRRVRLSSAIMSCTLSGRLKPSPSSLPKTPATATVAAVRSSSTRARPSRPCSHRTDDAGADEHGKDDQARTRASVASQWRRAVRDRSGRPRCGLGGHGSPAISA